MSCRDNAAQLITKICQCIDVWVFFVQWPKYFSSHWKTLEISIHCKIIMLIKENQSNNRLFVLTVGKRFTLFADFGNSKLSLFWKKSTTEVSISFIATNNYYLELFCCSTRLFTHSRWQWRLTWYIFYTKNKFNNTILWWWKRICLVSFSLYTPFMLILLFCFYLTIS